MKKTLHWESQTLAQLQRTAYEYGVQGRRFTNKANLIHAMRQAYWAQERRDAGSR